MECWLLIYLTFCKIIYHKQLTIRLASVFGAKSEREKCIKIENIYTARRIRFLV